MILPGAIQAATGIIIGYPFDTIKSIMQKNPNKFNSSYQCLYKTIYDNGFLYLYRGVPAPLSIMMIKRGVQYDCYEKLNNYGTNSYFNGFFVGGLGSIIGCPMHYIKINMQLNKTNNYNTLDFVKYTLKNDGLKKFYFGIKIDCLKESSFGAMYLGTYALMRDNLENNPINHFLAGGISSIITWIILFPIDSLRTNIMSSHSNSISYNLKCIIKNKSIINLWSGLSPVLIRVFPVSSISMLTYEYTRTLCNKYFD